jgi:hypothetical protein
MRAALVTLASCAVLSSACGGGRFPEPALAPQPESAFVDVPYPPPAAHVESLPARPEREALWVDGQWTWDGARWTWAPGAWVIAQPGARFAPWALRMQPNGRLQFAAASWRDASGREVPPARVLATAIGEGASRTVPVRCP